MRKRGQKPSAHSLVEMLAAISISTVLLGIALGIVSRSMSLVSVSQERDRMQLTLNRLVDDLRHDVHRAHSLRVSSREERTFQLQMESATLGQITYWQVGKVIFREIAKADTPLQRAYYRVDDDTLVACAEIAQPRGVSIEVTRRTPIKGEEPRLLAYLEIETGRLLRLAKDSPITREDSEE